MRLNQVLLPTRDVPRAVAFYRRLGFTPITINDHYARFLLPDGYSTLSVELAAAAIPDSPLTVCFECDDLDDRCAALRAAGVDFEHDPVDQRWLWREARLRDADGNRLLLFRAGDNRIDPPWRIREQGR